MFGDFTGTMRAEGSGSSARARRCARRGGDITMIEGDPLFGERVGLTPQRLSGLVPVWWLYPDPREHTADRAVRITFQVVLVADRQRLEAVLGEEISPAAIV